ncbi:MAG: radical SAM protein [Candidatus Thermoplasmatota archaeon]|nr:radical SAM protein [Candidatus Thermoplasmatota archaeon]
MKINEIFYSIQGEGKWTGLPNIFIRTTGCNLRCSYCDTKYAYDEGTEKSIKDILKEIKKFSCKNICITGGEPLLQSDILKLLEFLIKENYSICLETNGSIGIEEVSKFPTLLISLDIKCPSSNMCTKMKLKNIELLRPNDQIKMIIKNEVDYNYARDIIMDYKPDCSIFFQPVWGTSSNSLAKWILKDSLKVRLGLQLHKIIWGEKRGK